MQMSTLYQLTDQWVQVTDLLQSGEYDEQTLKDTLEAIQVSLEEKVDGYAAVIKNFDAENVAIDIEIKRLQERKRINTNAITRLKENLLYSLEQTGQKKIKTALNTATIRNNAPSLEISDDSKIPKEFYIDQEPKLDKRELLNYVKDTGEFEGVSIKRTQSLVVK